MEVWKDIKGYEGMYQVSNYGNVRSLDYRRMGAIKVLKPFNDKYGYKAICLVKNKQKHTFTVHRLVAIAFISNPNNYPCVNHKNEIRDDNRVENLEWCTVKYNTNYGGCLEKRSLNNPRSKTVIMNGLKFHSISMAAKYFSEDVSSLHNAFRRGRTTFKGHTIELKKEAD